MPRGYDFFLIATGFFLLGWAIGLVLHGSPIAPIAIVAAVGSSLLIGGVLLSGAFIIADAIKK
jgi:hypothetical protein